MVDKQFVSKTLIYCEWAIGVIICVASFILPRLSGYKSSGYELFSRGSFILIDLSILIPGLLFLVLDCFNKEGFRIQSETDEIL